MRHSACHQVESAKLPNELQWSLVTQMHT